MSTISENLQTIKERIAQAAGRSGRKPEAVRLVAVSKLVSAERIIEAIAAGQLIFGENYVQEARDKIPAISNGVSWHFIGKFQSNKANTVADIFQMVQTVDRLKLAQALDRRLTAQGRRLDILLEVNIGREIQKAGVLPEQVEGLLVEINRSCRSLIVKGLMAMPPFFAEPAAGRPFFRNLRILVEEMHKKGLFPGTDQPELSMGMSADYEVAIEEGATLVRIGTAIFGERA